MPKYLICFLTVSLLTISNLSAQRYDLFLIGDPILEDIRYLSIASGRAFLSFTPPFAPGEVRNFLDSIDESSLSGTAAREAYSRIRNRLSGKSNLSISNGPLTASIDVNSAITGRVRFNRDVNEYPENPNIDPFISLPLKFSFTDVLQLYVEPSVTMRPNKYNLDIFDLNIPNDYAVYDESNPLKAFAAAGGSWWNFQIGRDRLFWGTGNTGSLTFSDNSQFFEFAYLSVFSPNFKYSVIINQFPMTLKRGLFPPDKDFDFNLDNNPSNWNDSSRIHESMNRYFYFHRCDITLFNRISLAIMEGVMIGNAPLELRYLNPMAIFHSFFSWVNYSKWESPYEGEEWIIGDMSGSFLSLEANLNIVKNLAVYGQVLINQFAVAGERKTYSEFPPNGIGYLTGIQFAHSFNIWHSVFFLEFIYTDPYLNLHSSPFNSFIQQNRYYQYYYIGYKRDTIALTFGAKFYNNDKIRITGDLAWICSGQHNEHGLIWNWTFGEKAFNEKTPTGIAENKFILSVGADWKIFSWLILKTGLTGIYSVNNNHIQDNNVFGGQALLSIGVRY